MSSLVKGVSVTPSATPIPTTISSHHVKKDLPTPRIELTTSPSLIDSVDHSTSTTNTNRMESDDGDGGVVELYLTRKETENENEKKSLDPTLPTNSELSSSPLLLSSESQNKMAEVVNLNHERTGAVASPLITLENSREVGHPAAALETQQSSIDQINKKEEEQEKREREITTIPSAKPQQEPTHSTKSMSEILLQEPTKAMCEMLLAPPKLAPPESLARWRWEMVNMCHLPDEARDTLKELRNDRKYVQKKAEDIYKERQTLLKKYHKEIERYETCAKKEHKRKEKEKEKQAKAEAKELDRLEKEKEKKAAKLQQQQQESNTTVTVTSSIPGSSTAFSSTFAKKQKTNNIAVLLSPATTSSSLNSNSVGGSGGKSGEDAPPSSGVPMEIVAGSGVGKVSAPASYLSTSMQELDSVLSACLQDPPSLSDLKTEFQTTLQRDRKPRKPKTARTIPPGLPPTIHPVCKLLKFAENTRPEYYGTFSKKSSKIKARNPFSKDESAELGPIDYDIDSDDEWMEEEGESVSSNDAEDNAAQREEDLEEDDGFLVPDGYFSEDEGFGEDVEEALLQKKVEDGDEAAKEAREALKKALKRKELEKERMAAELKRGHIWSKKDPMVPIVIAPLLSGVIPESVPSKHHFFYTDISVTVLHTPQPPSSLQPPPPLRSISPIPISTTTPTLLGKSECGEEGSNLVPAASSTQPVNHSGIIDLNEPIEEKSLKKKNEKKESTKKEKKKTTKVKVVGGDRGLEILLGKQTLHKKEQGQDESSESENEKKNRKEKKRKIDEDARKRGLELLLGTSPRLSLDSGAESDKKTKKKIIKKESEPDKKKRKRASKGGDEESENGESSVGKSVTDGSGDMDQPQQQDGGEGQKKRGSTGGSGKRKSVEGGGGESNKVSIPSVTGQHLSELMELAFHKETSKQEIIKQFSMRHPNVPKAHVLTKFTEMFTKEKKDNDKKQYWYLNESFESKLDVPTYLAIFRNSNPTNCALKFTGVCQQISDQLACLYKAMFRRYLRPTPLQNSDSEMISDRDRDSGLPNLEDSSPVQKIFGDHDQHLVGSVRNSNLLTALLPSLPNQLLEKSKIIDPTHKHFLLSILSFSLFGFEDRVSVYDDQSISQLVSNFAGSRLLFEMAEIIVSAGKCISEWGDRISPPTPTPTPPVPTPPMISAPDSAPIPSPAVSTSTTISLDLNDSSAASSPAEIITLSPSPPTATATTILSEPLITTTASDSTSPKSVEGEISPPPEMEIQISKQQNEKMETETKEEREEEGSITFSPLKTGSNKFSISLLQTEMKQQEKIIENPQAGPISKQPHQHQQSITAFLIKPTGVSIPISTSAAPVSGVPTPPASAPAPAQPPLSQKDCLLYLSAITKILNAFVKLLKLFSFAKIIENSNEMKSLSSGGDHQPQPETEISTSPRVEKISTSQHHPDAFLTIQNCLTILNGQLATIFGEAHVTRALEAVCQTVEKWESGNTSAIPHQIQEASKALVSFLSTISTTPLAPSPTPQLLSNQTISNFISQQVFSPIIASRRTALDSGGEIPKFDRFDWLELLDTNDQSCSRMSDVSQSSPSFLGKDKTVLHACLLALAFTEHCPSLQNSTLSSFLSLFSDDRHKQPSVSTENGGGGGGESSSLKPEVEISSSGSGSGSGLSLRRISTSGLSSERDVAKIAWNVLCEILSNEANKPMKQEEP